MTNPSQSFKLILKRIIPNSIWVVIIAIYVYIGRLSVWLALMWQVRGASCFDQAKLFLSALLAPITCLNDLGIWQDPQLLFDCTVRVKGVGLFFLRKFTDDLYHVFPGREHRVFSHHRENLVNGDVYIDAGANIGFYTVLASKLVGHAGKVIAIEMVPETMSILVKNCKLNKLSNVTFVNNALSKSDNKPVKASVFAGHFGQSSIYRHESHMVKHYVSTTTVTLNSMISASSLAAVRLIKLDIEDAEFFALQGCMASFNKVQSFIYEALSREKSNEISELLVSSGYDISPLDMRNSLALRNH